MELQCSEIKLETEELNRIHNRNVSRKYFAGKKSILECTTLSFRFISETLTTFGP